MAALLLGLSLAAQGCGTGTERPPPGAAVGDDDDDDDDAAAGRWTGGAQVRVVDPDGDPVEGAFALLGGALDGD